VVEGEANANVQGHDQIGQDVQGRGHCKRKEKAKKHHNEDLPGYPDSLKNFHNQVLPCWYYYISSLNEPWDLVHPEHVHLAQLLWDRYVKVPKHVVALRDEAVFSLVSEDEISLAMLTLILSKLKQRACEW
jgi:hypothetical protein